MNAQTEAGGHTPVHHSWALQRLRCNADSRGSLVVVEDVPFPIRRAFWIYGVPSGAVRGGHANRISRMLFVCVAGRCTVSVDDGQDRMTWALEDPAVGVLAEAMTWKEMYDFSPDAVLLVLSDALYDSRDYIRDYSEFKRLAAGLRLQESTEC